MKSKPTSYVVQYDHLTDCYVKIPQYPARNWGQIERKIKVHKRYILSPFVLNLTEEAKKWSELEKRLRGEINEIDKLTGGELKSTWKKDV